MIIEIQDLTKFYNHEAVLSHLNLLFDASSPNCLMSPSGSGKTTLLRLIMGLEQPDAGCISITDGQGETPEGPVRFSAVFQEDRLCELFSPMENVMMVTRKSLPAQEVRSQLSRLLPEECLDRPVCTLSGGMKRRAAICRALLAPSQILLMDEPFTGLDEDNRLLAIRYIQELVNGRLLILTTHQEEDVALLDGRLVRLQVR